jgi:hypothetical protein
MADGGWSAQAHGGDDVMRLGSIKKQREVASHIDGKLLAKKEASEDRW